MNEIKKPKKSIYYFYGIMMIAIVLFNFLVMPWFTERQIKNVDYGTFMEMTENKEIKQVEVQDNQILFTDSKDQIYKTGKMDDPELVNRLKESGASGAELANIVNEAALRAVRDNRKFATQADLEESIEVVIAGYQKKNAILTEKEKWTVAYHEIGHALVAAKQTDSAPVQKITIIPRTSGALGYTMQIEEGNHYLLTKEEIENKIATYTGGRAAEELTYGTISTGAANDIEQAIGIILL